MKTLALLPMIAVLAACTQTVVPVESATAAAERKRAAEHFGNSQYAQVEPLQADPNAAAAAKDSPPAAPDAPPAPSPSP